MIVGIGRGEKGMGNRLDVSFITLPYLMLCMSMIR